MVKIYTTSRGDAQVANMRHGTRWSGPSGIKTQGSTFELEDFEQRRHYRKHAGKMRGFLKAAKNGNVRATKAIIHLKQANSLAVRNKYRKPTKITLKFLDNV